MGGTFTGFCTYYNLVGRSTASGEMFNPNGMNAAMTAEKAPLGVTVKSNTKRVAKRLRFGLMTVGPFKGELTRKRFDLFSLTGK